MKIEAVKLMRQLRAKISREIAGMTSAERLEYFRKHSQDFDAMQKRRAHRGNLL